MIGTKTPINEETIRQAEEKLGIQNGYMRLKIGKVNPEWSQFNLFEIPVEITGETGEGCVGFKPSDYKLIVKATENEPTVVHIPKKDYVLLPNAVVQDTVTSLAKERGYSLYADDRYSRYTHDGNGMILCYLPPDYNGSAFAEKEQLKIGFAVRNSINGSMGFGFDLFSYRGLCENGSIVGRKDQASLYARHVRTLADIIDKGLDRFLEDIMNKGEQLLSFYESLQSIALNKERAQIILNSKLPKKMLSTWTIDEGVVREVPHMNMWEMYNASTNFIWHNAKTDIRTKKVYFDKLHIAVNQVAQIAGLESFGSVNSSGHGDFSP